jgi:threonine synthase
LARDWTPPLTCGGCGAAYPADSLPTRCSRCGGLYQWDGPEAQAFSTEIKAGRGLERYQSRFPLPPEATFISLGEGGTPLVSVPVQGRTFYFKCEHLNPTGSFKDRGTAVLVSALLALGIRQAVEDSSGNAGASFAAYAARAGIAARVFIPESSSGPKRAQIEAYGADVVRIPGPRSQTAEAVLQAAAGGVAYASHAYLPHGLAGMATVAYELTEQLGRAPGAVVMPVGQGTLLLGVYQGFEALRRVGRITDLPRLIGVQAHACAPLWAVERYGAAGLDLTTEGDTLAEGIRIARPLRGDALLAAVSQSGGRFEAVEEQAILSGRDALSRAGFYVEPTSAVVWPGLLQAWAQLSDPVVVVLTGSGYKSP